MHVIYLIQGTTTKMVSEVKYGQSPWENHMKIPLKMLIDLKIFFNHHNLLLFFTISIYFTML